ncbi:MAG: tripartite tricarboxylate transporter TctB family protein [Mesorhizobium sp.]
MQQDQDETHGQTTPDAATLSLSLEISDIAVGLALATLAGWFFFQASILPDFSGTAIGAADFPKGLAALLGLTSVIFAGAGVRRIVSGRLGERVSVRQPMRVLLGIVLLIAFPFMMDAFGYYIAMAIFLSAFLYVANRRNPIAIALYVGGFLLFTKLVFEMMLGTPLP